MAHPKQKMRCYLDLAGASLPLILVFPGLLPAQNTDSVILENSRQFTVLDQISDRTERAAVLEIYRAHSPRDKADKAETFLGRYPRSWLLAQVYEIAAKAYIDLGEFDRALQYGRASLAILRKGGREMDGRCLPQGRTPEGNGFDKTPANI